MAFDSQAAIANRLDFDKTYTTEFTADQTNATLFSPPTGKVIAIKSIYISTLATSGFIRLIMDSDTVVTFFPTSGTSTVQVTTYKRGLVNSGLKVTSTFGDAKNYFILVNYKVE